MTRLVRDVTDFHAGHIGTLILICELIRLAARPQSMREPCRETALAHASSVIRADRHTRTSAGTRTQSTVTKPYPALAGMDRSRRRLKIEQFAVGLEIVGQAAIVGIEHEPQRPGKGNAKERKYEKFAAVDDDCVWR